LVAPRSVALTQLLEWNAPIQQVPHHQIPGVVAGRLVLLSELEVQQRLGRQWLLALGFALLELQSSLPVWLWI
jgi:hypothetical protein